MGPRLECSTTGLPATLFTGSFKFRGGPDLQKSLTFVLTGLMDKALAS